MKTRQPNPASLAKNERQDFSRIVNGEICTQKPANNVDQKNENQKGDWLSESERYGGCDRMGKQQHCKLSVLCRD